MPRPFLTARWSNLVLLTFEAPEELLEAHIPLGMEPDSWQRKTHVSLVALEMTDVRVRGWRIPAFSAYPQVNFRTYGRLAGEAAVSFIREFVPSRLVAAVARARYREPFRAMPIESRVEAAGDDVRIAYRFGPDAGLGSITARGSRATHVPPPTSIEHYLKERTLGCRRGRRGELRCFRVAHPPWAVREVRSFDYAVDFASVYGPEWGFLNDREPVSVIFAVGSEVKVFEPSAVTDSTSTSPSP